MTKPKAGLGAGRLSRMGPVPNVAAAMVPAALDAETLRTVPPGSIARSPWQPRTAMDPGALEELADSIRQHGILEPLLVRELLVTGHGPEGRLELLAGERRLEAAKLAGLASVPVRVLNVTDQEAAAIGLTENLAREDLTAWEEAHGLAKLRDNLAAAGLAHTVRELAPMVGWSTGKVTERLQIADAITPAVLERSRADVHAVNKQTKAALLLVSQGGNIAERAERLARYILPEGKRPPVARKPGRPAEPFTLQSPKSGRVAFRLRKPAAELEPEEARAALERLEPVLEALRARAGE